MPATEIVPLLTIPPVNSETSLIMMPLDDGSADGILPLLTSPGTLNLRHRDTARETEPAARGGNRAGIDDAAKKRCRRRRQKYRYWR